MRTIASQHINYLDRFWDLYQKLPYETARYVPRFLATVLVIRDPQKYGIDLGTPKAAALSYEIVEINKPRSYEDCLTYYMYVKQCPSHMIAGVNVNIHDIIVCMKDGQEDRLLKYKIGDKIIYKAHISRTNRAFIMGAVDGEIIK